MKQDSSFFREKPSGVFAPISTPFDEKGNLLLDRLASNINNLNGSGLRGYLILGTNGEFKSLSEEEQKNVVATAVKASSKDKVIMVGTGRESTHHHSRNQRSSNHGSSFRESQRPFLLP